MVLVLASMAGPLASLPHERGDGPVDDGPLPEVETSSPRAWGWSAVLDRCLLPESVFPTSVGMVL